MKKLSALLLLLVVPAAAAAPESVTVTTKHYRLEAETSRATAEDYGRVLEAAWPKLREFFGAEPELEKDERLRIIFCATRESFARRLLAEGIQPPAAGGYYHLPSRTAFAWRQPTIYFTRCLLLHEAIHQLHYLAKTSNHTGLAGWYAEGIAEFLSRHHLDGEKLTLGVVPMITLEDSSRAALEALSADGADRISADLKVPDSTTWMAGLLLDHQSGSDYTVALTTSEGKLRIHRRQGRLEDCALPVPDSAESIRLEAVRSDGEVRLRIDGTVIGAWKLPGPALGLAIQGGVATFRNVTWGRTPEGSDPTSDDR